MRYEISDAEIELDGTNSCHTLLAYVIRDFKVSEHLRFWKLRIKIYNKGV